MTDPDAETRTPRYMAAVDATWPPAEIRQEGPWRLRRGDGGGKRVSSASTDQPVSGAEIDAAVAAMRAMGQGPLFCLRPGQDQLDSALAARGYRVVDPVNIYACATEALAGQKKPAQCFSLAVWEPLAIQREIWAAGGIGPARIAVMERARGARTALIGRHDNSPAATAFVALDGTVAMLHALEVLAAMRGRGMGRAMMIDAARWAAEQGAEEISVICTTGNVAANGLYGALGMELVGHYHYRQGD